MLPKRPATPTSADMVRTERGHRSFEKYSQLYPSLPDRIDAVLKSEIPYVQERIGFFRAFVARKSGERPEWFSRKYGLTPTEARIAAFVTEGGSVRQYAKTYRTSEATVRTHLKAIFRKTGASRQSDLSRLILQPKRMFGYSP